MILAGIDLGALWETVRGPLLQSLAVLAGAGVLWRLLHVFGERWLRRVEENLESSPHLHDRERAQRLRTLWTIGRSTLVVVLLVIGVLTLMGIWGIPVGPFLAVGSLVGVAIGFGAQSLVKDVIAGFLIIAEDQYAIGDVVEIAGVSGAVEAIRLRTTVLRDLDGKVHYVPNGQVTVATNITHRFSRMVVDVGIGYGEDVDRALAVVGDEAEALVADPDWAEAFVDGPQVLGVNALDDWAVVLRVVFTTVPDRRWAVKREFLRRIKNRLDAEGIEIPYPYLNVVERPDGGT